AFNSLPPEAQRKYLEDLAGQAEGKAEMPSPSPAPAEKITTVAELVAKYGQERADKILEKAFERERWVKEFFAIRDSEEKNKLDRIKALAKKRTISETTLYRWAEAYEKEGLLGLVHDKYRQPGPGLDFTNRRTVPPEMRDFIVGLYATYDARREPKVSHVIREVKRVAAERGWEVPSKATFYRVIEEIREGLKTAGRKGIEEWRKTHMPKTQRDVTANMVNEYWVGDGHDFNIFVDFYGRPKKISASVWMDWRSRKVTGWCVADQTNSRTIGLALRHGIRSCGVPGTVYTDNGKDYKSKYLSAVYADLGIEELFCTPRQPWAKPIERFFETLNDQVIRHLPGFCGDNPNERPAGFDEKKLHRAGKLLKIEEFVEIFARAVEEYNDTVHSTLNDTPNHVFDSLPKFRPGKVNERLLDILLMVREHAKVSPLGVRVCRRWFWAEELSDLVGEEVQLRYDPNRLAEILIFYRGQLVTVATNAEVSRMGASPEMLEKIARKKYRAEKNIKNEIKRYNETVEAILSGKPHLFPGAGQADPDNVQLLTGKERLVKEVEAAREKQKGRSQKEQTLSRSERLLMERGARVLSR
ncbi:MAG: Mu transposase C-terminal domain-containing protein, partial [Bacillota bacterium]